MTWSPSGDWLLTCNNSDRACRLWDVTGPFKGEDGFKTPQNKEGLPVRLDNQMVCQMKLKEEVVDKVLFHTETDIVAISRSKTILRW